MTSLQDRPNTALMVIDMQLGVVSDAFEVERVIDNINKLVDRARAVAVPIIWVQHSDDELVEGSDSWQYVDELRRADDEPLVHKRYGDSFEETDLESILAERHVGRLVVTGAQTDACIRSTLHGALADTTPRWCPMPTRPRTCGSGAPRSARPRPLPTPTSTGAAPMLRAAPAPRPPPPTSPSPDPVRALPRHPPASDERTARMTTLGSSQPGRVGQR